MQFEACFSTWYLYYLTDLKELDLTGNLLSDWKVSFSQPKVLMNHYISVDELKLLIHHVLAVGDWMALCNTSSLYWSRICGLYRLSFQRFHLNGYVVEKLELHYFEQYWRPNAPHSSFPWMKKRKKEKGFQEKPSCLELQCGIISIEFLILR